MAKQAAKHLANLDLAQNELINVVIDNLSAYPSVPKIGQIIYHTTHKAIEFWDGTQWVIWIRVKAGNGLVESANGLDINFDVNVDNLTLEIDTDTVRIKDLGVSTAKLADNAVTTIKVTDKAITFAKLQDIPTMTVIGRVAAGSGVPSAIPILNESDLGSNSATSLATQSSIKAYIDSRVAGLGQLIGSFDASGNTLMPTNGATTKKGDYWHVTVAGTVQGVILNVGDVIIANQNTPTNTNPNHYIVLESNRSQATTTVLGVVMLASNADMTANVMTESSKVVTPALLQQVIASETKSGLAEIATQAETDAGTDDSRIVTPLKLKSTLDKHSGGWVANIGNSSATDFVVTHSANTKNVAVHVYDNTTDEEVIVKKTTTSITTVTVSFGANSVPAANQYRVVIKKIV